MNKTSLEEVQLIELAQLAGAYYRALIAQGFAQDFAERVTEDWLREMHRERMSRF